MGKKIYVQGVHGEFHKVGEALHPDRRNFLIRYEGMDWSGFRTLKDCESQLLELSSRGKNEHFTVEEV